MYNHRVSVSQVFDKCQAVGKKTFIPFVTCGYKCKNDTVPILLAFQRGGADIIELGVPFSDPQADGPTIQAAHQVGVDQGISILDVLDTVKQARTQGLNIPVILMGYLNNFLAFGLEKICQLSKEAEADGFIIVDLPPEEASEINSLVKQYDLCYIPLVSPTTSAARMKNIGELARGYVYCVSLTGVTGIRDHLPPGLSSFMKRVRDNISLPLALGFGISCKEQLDEAGQYADAVVIGSKIIKVITEAGESSAERAEAVFQFCLSITA